MNTKLSTLTSVARIRLSLALLLSLTLAAPALWAQGSLAPGELTPGNISPAGDTDTWTFSASVGDSIVVRAGETTPGSTLYPWVRLYGPDGRLLDASYNPAVAEAAFRATNSGTFTVVVADGNTGAVGTGSYRLTLGVTGALVGISAGDEGGPLRNGAMHTGTIQVGDLDIWTFTASAGETFILRVGEVSSSETLYPWIRLFGPDGRLLDDAYNPAAAETVFRATNSGTFMLMVADANTGYGGTGSYRLTLAKTGSPVEVSTSDEGGPLSNGVLHTGRIEVGDLDTWTFTATAGESLVVRIGEVSAAESLYPWVRLFGPDGRLLDEGYNPAAAEAAFRATNSGTFILIIGDANSGNGGTGSYRLTLAKTGSPVEVSAGDEGGPLTNGVLHTGRIEVGDLDMWTFTATAGESLVLRIGELSAAESLYPWIRLFGPDGRLLDEGYNPAAAETAFRATNSGTFILIVGDANSGNGGTGSYRLTLTKTGSPIVVSAADDGGGLINGMMHPGKIEVGDLDVWSFTANAGASFIVRVGQVSSTESLYPWIRLFGPDGRLLDEGYNPSAAETVFRATNSGTFTVVVADANSGYGGAGSYRLTLAQTGSAIVSSEGDQSGPLIGESMDGMIETGDLDLFNFNSCVAEPIDIEVTEAVAGSGLYPWIRLYGRDGTLLNSAYGPGSARITRTAPHSGSFLLVVGDANSGLGGAGAYYLTAPGLSAGTKMCIPRRGSGGTVLQGGVGGTPGKDYVIITATNITTPVALWAPILTNKFGTFGEFSFTNRIDPNVTAQFFRYLIP